MTSNIIDMSRGKPDFEQIKLSSKMYNVINDEIFDKYQDYFNYGGVLGIKEIREFFSDILSVDFSEVLVNDNSSLRLLHDIISWYLILGVNENSKPWIKNEETIFLCPVPGYDRHFSILENFGIKMINISMNENGPDIDEVEKLVKSNSNIKAFICSPTFSNPTGTTFDEKIIKRLLKMETAAEDFRIFFDDAYKFHRFVDFSDTKEELNILELAKKYSNENRVLMFFSTSKITIPGAGVSVFVSSKKNIDYISNKLNIQSVGPNKVNQLQHILFLKNKDLLKKHMQSHANIMYPKFQLVNKILSDYFSKMDSVSWNIPEGGYFVSVKLPKGTAKNVVSNCLKEGVKITDAGSEYPYKYNPNDDTIRLAPSYLSLSELEKAIRIISEVIKKMI